MHKPLLLFNLNPRELGWSSNSNDSHLRSTSEELYKIAQIADKRSYQVEDFFRNPDTFDFKISPDGQKIAFISTSNNEVRFQVLHKGSTKALGPGFERLIKNYYWGNNDTIVFTKDNNGDENYQLYSLNTESGEFVQLYDNPEVRVHIIDPLNHDPDTMLISMNERNHKLFEAYTIRLSDGQLQRVADNTLEDAPIIQWVPDQNGVVRAGIQMFDGVNSRLLYRATAEDPFHSLVETDFKTSIQPLYFDANRSHIIICKSNYARDKYAIVEFDALQKKEVKILYEDAEMDVFDIGYSQSRNRITNVQIHRERLDRVFIDPDAQAAYQDIRNAFSEELCIDIVSSSMCEQRHVIKVYSDKVRGVYYRYDLSTKSLDHLADSTPWLDESEMATTQAFSFTSRDGMKMHAYLTLPKGQENQQGLPLVVNPHGGPWTRDTWGFNPEVQLLAHYGYAVLQVNFRGSTGYGRKFWEASFKQWGQSMQDDLIDGVQHLIDKGTADPQRIAIYGASYGGYAALAGLTYTPDIFRCGIDFVGVSNLITFMESFPPYWKPLLSVIYEQVGHPVDDRAMLEAYSPALNSEKIIAPLFVVQGANDPRVSIKESDQIVDALRQRGIDVTYLVKDNEGHGFYQQENRFEFYRTMLGFLAKHMQ